MKFSYNITTIFFIDIVWMILVLYFLLVICIKTMLILDIGVVVAVVVVVIMIMTMKSSPLSREGKPPLGELHPPRPHKVKTPGNLEEI